MRRPEALRAAADRLEATAASLDHVLDALVRQRHAVVWRGPAATAFDDHVTLHRRRLAEVCASARRRAQLLRAEALERETAAQRADVGPVGAGSGWPC